MKIIKKLEKNEMKQWLLRSINIEDEALYKEANNPNMIGIFQLTAGTAKFMVESIKPSNFDELNACSAFARPGTMDFVPQYIKNRETKKSPYPKAVADILHETHSIILYQEQVMAVFNKIGGFSLEETNTIRGLMKKLGKLEKKKEDLDAWDEVIKRFQEGAQEKGITKSDAKKIADDLLKMSSYNFNKSHSTAYTYLAVVTLYLSYYFRKYFYSSVLHYEVGRDKYLLDRLRAVKVQGFKILPPDINKSSKFIAPVKGSTDELVFGLEDVKHVGGNPADVILSNQPYKDFMDFYLKIQGNRITIRAVRALISIGAFDSLYKDRKRLLTKVDRFWEQKKTIKVEEKLRFLWNNIEKQIDALPGLDATQDDLRDYEREYLGFNFFITPFSPEFMEKMNILKQKGLAEICFADISKSSVKVPVVVSSMRVFNDKNGKEMAFIELEDYTGERLTIPIFQSLWMHVKAYIVQGKVHLINLYRQKKDDGSEQIMFGKSGWPKPTEIERFVKRLDNL
jgi:DNA polymerase-3 subunit alpha